jgi:hypothetical protein
MQLGKIYLAQPSNCLSRNTFNKSALNMSLTIEDQFDMVWPATCIAATARGMVKSGLFYEGVEKLVLSDARFAICALKQIEMGRVDIFRQESVLIWMQKLSTLAERRSASEELRSGFYSAMGSIAINTNARFTRRGYKQALSPADASECYGLGGDAGVISYGLRNARYLVNRELFRIFGESHLAPRDPRYIDRPGKATIVISNPKDAGYALNFVGRYQGGGSITQSEEHKWALKFDEHVDSKCSAFEWNGGLWARAYSEIVPMLEKLFEADVQVSIDWQFDD